MSIENTMSELEKDNLIRRHEKKLEEARLVIDGQENQIKGLRKEIHFLEMALKKRDDHIDKQNNTIEEMRNEDGLLDDVEAIIQEKIDNIAKTYSLKIQQIRKWLDNNEKKDIQIVYFNILNKVVPAAHNSKLKIKILKEVKKEIEKLKRDSINKIEDTPKNWEEDEEGAFIGKTTGDSYGGGNEGSINDVDRIKKEDERLYKRNNELEDNYRIIIGRCEKLENDYYELQDKYDRAVKDYEAMLKFPANIRKEIEKKKEVVNEIIDMRRNSLKERNERNDKNIEFNSMNVEESRKDLNDLDKYNDRIGVYNDVLHLINKMLQGD